MRVVRLNAWVAKPLSPPQAVDGTDACSRLSPLSGARAVARRLLEGASVSPVGVPGPRQPVLRCSSLAPGRANATPRPSMAGPPPLQDPLGSFVQAFDGLVAVAAQVEALPIIPVDDRVQGSDLRGVPSGVTLVSLLERVTSLRDQLVAAMRQLPAPLRPAPAGGPSSLTELVPRGLRTEAFCRQLEQLSGRPELALRYRQVLPLWERTGLVLSNLESVRPTSELEVLSHFLPDGSIRPGHEDQWVLMTRGRQIEIAMAIKRSHTAGGFPRGTHRGNVSAAVDLVPLDEAPRPTTADVRLQVAQGSHLPEYTTAVRHGFGHYGALVVARLRVGDLVRGSRSEGGWCLNHRARIDPLFVLQTRDTSSWIQGA